MVKENENKNKVKFHRKKCEKIIQTKQHVKRMERKIDIVIPWVDGSDKIWLEEKRKYPDVYPQAILGYCVYFGLDGRKAPGYNWNINRRRAS